MKLRIFISAVILSVLTIFTFTNAQTPFPTTTANGVAIYGWKNNERVPIYVNREHTLFPIASLTKLITALVAEDLYLPVEVLTVTKSATATEGATPGIIVGAKYTRDDLLKALLVNSSNDAAAVLAETVGNKIFIERMNDVLHKGEYTSTSFINPSGLDPSKKSGNKPNRMTPYHMTSLLNDIYVNNPTLRSFMELETATITDLRNNKSFTLKQTNALFRDELYKDKILMSKTGLTNMAGQNLAFVAPGTEEFDYITVVFFGSNSRNVDGRKILGWLDANFTPRINSLAINK